MDNTVELEFNKSITRLAYYPYGKKVYEEQVKDKIDFSKENITIVFPNHIVKAASSFVQGFFEEIIEKYGFDFIYNRINIVSVNESLKKSIYDNLI